MIRLFVCKGLHKCELRVARPPHQALASFLSAANKRRRALSAARPPASHPQCLSGWCLPTLVSEPICRLLRASCDFTLYPVVMVPALGFQRWGRTSIVTNALAETGATQKSPVVCCEVLRALISDLAASNTILTKPACTIGCSASMQKAQPHPP